MARKQRTSDEYDVGYGKPPIATQFKPGQSGNPKGRKKGRRNLKTIIASALEEKVTIREGNQSRRVTVQEAIIKRFALKAANGDARSLRELGVLMVRAGIFDNINLKDQQEDDLSTHDRAILEDFIQRQVKNSGNGSLGPR